MFLRMFSLMDMNSKSIGATFAFRVPSKISDFIVEYVISSTFVRVALRASNSCISTKTLWK